MVLWSIQDHISTLATDSGAIKSSGFGGIKTPKGAGGDDKPSDSPSIKARGIFQGHGDTVEDVQFCPTRYIYILHGAMDTVTCIDCESVFNCCREYLGLTIISFSWGVDTIKTGFIISFSK